MASSGTTSGTAPRRAPSARAAARRLPRRSWLAALGALGGAPLVACGPDPAAPGAGSAETPGGGGDARGAAARRLRIGTSFEVTNLSPHDNHYWLTTYGAAQSLLRLGFDERLEPWIAQSVTPDGTEGYTIRLNPAARFHNGKPIDARQVQTALQRHLEAGVRSIPSLAGARWEAPDAHTLRVRTAEPDPWLPNTLAQAYLPIFDVDEVPEPGALKGDALGALAGKGYFSGPFRVTRLTPQELVLDAVPGAWDGAPRLAGVDVRFIKDPQARLTALRTGEIDIMAYVPSDAVPQIRQTAGLHFKKNDVAGRWRLVLNNRRAPFDEVAVRQAVALGIDRKQIADHVMNGALGVPETVYPEAMPWTVKGVLRTDVAAARKALEDAGWRPGPDGVRARGGRRLGFEVVHYPQQPDAKPMAEALQAQFKALGMEVRLRQVEDITSTLRSGEYDAGVITLTMQTAGYPMPQLNATFLTGARDNYGWGSAQVDEVIRRLNVEFDPARRIDLLQQVQEWFRRDVPFTFVTTRPWAVAVNDAFRDYRLGIDVEHYIVRKDVAPAAGR